MNGSFSLVAGGPLYRRLRALGVIRDDGHDTRRLIALSVAVTWAPLAILSVLEWSRTGRLSPLFDHIGFHVRLLVAIPLLFVAERSVHGRTRRCIDRFLGGGWAGEGEAAVARLTSSAARWRDATTPELLLFALAIAGSQAVLAGLTGPLGVAKEHAEARWSAVMIWYGFVALPAWQFLLVRWLWRWAIWSRLLWGLSRLRLRPIATHPDRNGGMGFLSEPSVGFAWVMAASSALQAGVWADAVIWGGVSLDSLKQYLGVIIILALLLTLGPLLVFAMALWRARFDAIRDYDALARDYTRLFHERWIVRGERDGLLGSADIQSLADLGNAYGVIRAMRLVPFRARAIIWVVAAIMVPMFPLILLRVPLLDLLQKLAGIALGGVPG